MDWKLFNEPIKLGRRSPAGRFVLPSAVLEIEPDFVAGARLRPSTGQVARLGVRELAAGSVRPQLDKPNITNAADVQQGISSIGEIVGNGNGRLGLLLPDGVVRVVILSFETLPDNQKEVEALVRWRLRESLPFPPEEARVTYQFMRHDPGSLELLAVAAKSSVVLEYESALEPINGGPALILPSTLALLPLLPEEGEAGQLLVHVCCGWMTTAVVWKSRLRFWRNRDLGHVAPEELGAEVAREAGRVLASSRDHLALEIGHVWLCLRPPATPELAIELARSLGEPTELLVPDPPLAPSFPSAERALLDRYGATFAGLVSNAR